MTGLPVPSMDALYSFLHFLKKSASSIHTDTGTVTRVSPMLGLGLRASGGSREGEGEPRGAVQADAPRRREFRVHGHACTVSAFGVYQVQGLSFFEFTV